MTSTPSLESEPPRITRQDQEVSASARPAVIPWGAYYTVYFVQAVIMSMILTNVPVFLRQGLALDWLGLTASFAVMMVPLLLRPLFAWVTDRRPALISSLLVSGVVLVVAGSILASTGAFTGAGGIFVLTIGFAIAVVGATLMNVAADSHIVRAVPLDKSARVNSYKRLYAFFGIVLGQGCYLFLVGGQFTDFGRWTAYFALPAVVAAVTWVVFSLRHGWHVLPSVESLPPVRAPWLVKAESSNVISKQPMYVFGLLLAIAFLFMLPDGLIEATFENFIVETYGTPSWLLYSKVMIAGIFLGAVGFTLARRSGRRGPEWDFLWYVPVIAAFDLLLWSMPAFSFILWPTIAIQIPASFIQVRLLQSWQGHSYTRRPALTFQVFVATYQLGKIVGIGISGFIMTFIGYSGIFAGAVVVWVIVLGLAVIYQYVAKK